MATATSLNSLGNTFAFIWNIENTDELFKREFIYSPSFNILPNSRDRWYLVLWNENSRGFTEIFLKRVENHNTTKNLKWKCEVCLLRSDGSRYYTVQGRRRIFSEGGFSFELIKKENLFDLKSELYPNGNLAVYCRLGCFGTTLQESNMCCGLTTLKREASAFLWSIKDFSSLKLGKIHSRCEKMRFESHPSVTLNLSLMEESDEIQIEFMKGYSKAEFITYWEIFIVSITGDVLHEKCFVWDITKKKNSVNLTNFFKKSDLMANKATHLPDDTLILAFNCILKQKNLLLFDFQGTKSSTNELNLESHSQYNNPTGTLSMDLINLYKESFFSDIKFQVGSETFFAHKALLCARSNFFKTMFTVDMKEKEDNCIELKDIEPKTFRRLLEYMYTDATEDLPYEDAASLYSAADKYGLVRLKKECSELLKNEISKSNACEMLVLADKYNDKELKSFVESFFLDQKFEMFRSAEWDSFYKTHLQLATEIMQNVILEITE